MRTHASRWLILLALTEMAQTGWAADLPNYTLDELTDAADVIVVVDPLQPHPERGSGGAEGQTMRFRVDQVLKGTDIERGQEISVRMGLYSLNRFGEPKDPEPELVKGLLFLHPLRKDGPAIYDPILSGVRYLTRTETVLRPDQEVNPGPFSLVPREAPSWEDLIRLVREDLSRIDGLRALRRIDDSRARNDAILAWLRAHPDDIEPGERRYFANADLPGGWGRAVDEAVIWIFESCDPEDCWSALALRNRVCGDRWKRVHGDRWWIPETQAPSFRSVEGRRLLAEVALDRERSVGERVCALRYLGNSSTLRDHGEWLVPSTVPATPEETHKLAEILAPLEKSVSASIVAATTRALAELKKPVEKSPFLTETEALLARYREAPIDEHTGVNRNGSVRRLAVRLDEKAWKALSGNPHGILVTFYLFQPTPSGGLMYVQADRLPLPVFERPILVLERMGDDGSVVETRQSPFLIEGREPSWSKGWGTGARFNATFPTSGLTPGRWRAKFVGVAGSQRAAWRSEPQGFPWPPR